MYLNGSLLNGAHVLPLQKDMIVTIVSMLLLSCTYCDSFMQVL